MACEGLGVIGKNQTSRESRGLRLHSSYAVSAEEGVPLGIWNWHCYAPQLKPERKGKDTRKIPLEEKDSQRWVTNLVGCMARDEELANTRVIHVMDREADFFDLFDHWKTAPGKDGLIVRAQHNRKVLRDPERTPEQDDDEQKEEGIFEAVRRQTPGGSVSVDIPRKSARQKKGKKKAQPKRAKRSAVLSLRWMKVSIAPPKQVLNSKRPPVEAWLLHASEETPPADGSKPIEWMLLSSIPIASEQTAIEVLGYYAKRWRIEDWHRILKTCCRVEEPAHRDAECLMRRYCQSQKLPEPTNLGEGVLLVAKLGGYLGRKHDGPPGAEVLWRGSRKLSNWCECAAFSWPSN